MFGVLGVLRRFWRSQLGFGDFEVIFGGFWKNFKDFNACEFFGEALWAFENFYEWLNRLGELGGSEVISVQGDG